MQYRVASRVLVLFVVREWYASDVIQFGWPDPTPMSVRVKFGISMRRSGLVSFPVLFTGISITTIRNLLRIAASGTGALAWRAGLSDENAGHGCRFIENLRLFTSSSPFP